ncbi:hypothetical protein JCGZ_06015 [Jatropha curcas]|uniref:Uncharacterized protein n=1 Tax=Jatropha curcas TaxID=180498 RepID=A0A067KS95_JATCU|nr:hypothetical protein JCGZ_06015 [Jatropha curcas]
MRIKSLVEEAVNGAGMGSALASELAAVGMLSMARKPLRCKREVTDRFCIKPCCQMQLAHSVFQTLEHIAFLTS